MTRFKPRPLTTAALTKKSSGFFILKPNVEKYDHMMELLKHTSPDPADKEQFDGVWHWGDQEMLRVVFQQEENKWNVLDGTL